jgi:imidazolonepropionase-like amidohydrolase
VTEETTAFANAMVFDGSSAGLREGCVRVAAGAIAGVGGGPEAGDRVVDCRGRAVVPGLIDAHFHAYGARLSLRDPSVLWGGPDRRAVFQGGIRVAEQDARLVL